MAPSVSPSMGRAHRLLSEIGPSPMAKADLKKLEVVWKTRVGEAVAQARNLIHLTQKELADAIEQATGEPRDVAQISRWEKGTERPQFDVLMAVEPLRGPLVICLAALSEQIEVETTIRIRRTA